MSITSFWYPKSLFATKSDVGHEHQSRERYQLAITPHSTPRAQCVVRTKKPEETLISARG